MKNLVILWILLLGFVVEAKAQTGSLTGKITDSLGEPVIGAIIQLSQGKRIRGGTSTDENGNYVIGRLRNGKYDIKVSSRGFVSVAIKEVTIISGEPVLVDVQMDTTGAGRIGIRAYSVPKVSPWNRYITQRPETARELLSAKTEGTGITQSPPSQKSFWQRLKFWK